MPLGLGLFRTVLRRIRSDWTVLLAAAATLLLTGILVSAAPIYSRAVNDAGLQRSLNDAEVTASNLEVSGRFDGSNFGEADQFVRDAIAPIYSMTDADLARVGESDSFAFPNQQDVQDLTKFGFYDRIEEHTTLVDGNWPETTGAPYQVALSRDAANLRDLSAGDELTLIYRHDDAYTVDIQVAGIYEVDDPNHPYWYDNELAIYGFSEGQSFDTYGPLVVTPQVFFEAATPRSSRIGWRIFPDFDGLTTATAPEVRRETTRLIDRVDESELYDSQMTVSTRLHTLIRTIERSLLVTQASVTIVVVQLAVLAGYALVLASRLIIDHRQVESAMLRARGASSRQLFGMSLLEAICLALPIVLIAPVLATVAVRGFNYVGPLTEINMQIEPAISSGAYLAASIAGVIGVLLLSVPVLREQTSVPGAQASRHRQGSSSLWQRAGIDLAILLVAAVGYLQLRRYSGAITETVEGTLGIDPLLVAAPSLGLLAGAILALRIVPLIAQLAERVAARQRAALVALGAWQIARRPLVYSRSMLLLLLAIGIGIFTVAYTQTWQQSQIDQADHRIGADIRVRPDTRYSRTVNPLTVSDAHRQINGVASSMPITERLEQFGSVRDLGTLFLIDSEYASNTILMREDLQPERFDGMLEEMRQARPEMQASPLPGEPARLSVQAQLAPEFPVDMEIDRDASEMLVRVTLLDGEGYLHRIDAGTVHPDDPQVTLEVDLADELGDGRVARPAYPLQIAAVEFSTQAPFMASYQGTLTLSEWRVSESLEGDDWQDVPAESLSQPEWEATAHPFDSNTQGEAALESAGETMRARFTTEAIPPVTIQLSTFRISPPAPEVDGSVPVLISQTLRELGDYDVGDTLLVPVGSFAFDGEVIGVLGAFPGTSAHTMPTIIADLPTVVAINDRPASDPFGSGERWVSLEGGDADEVVETLREPPYTSRRVEASDQRAAELQQDPVALGTLGALSMGFIAASVVAGAGIMASAAGSARQRMSEFLLMRAIGLSPRQLSGWLLMENSLVILLGVIGGTLLGLMLGWLMLPLISLTQTASQVFPGVRVVIPWETIGLVQVAGIALLVLLTLALVVIVRRGGLGEALRVRDD